ncbi:uncharacterized protein LOC121367453 [Gigantopelta aegis]|uniref:uncharacterized protein LOC121367453 n=1 Tax=Gigantopelta aegis TaxID=1735272 RepID=UPI001B88C684|nr:uncharacterized protein LOC121367453 [Gigantopelta aegis]
MERRNGNYSYLYEGNWSYEMCEPKSGWKRLRRNRQSRQTNNRPVGSGYPLSVIWDDRACSPERGDEYLASVQETIEENGSDAVIQNGFVPTVPPRRRRPPIDTRTRQRQLLNRASWSGTVDDSDSYQTHTSRVYPETSNGCASQNGHVKTKVKNSVVERRNGFRQERNTSVSSTSQVSLSNRNYYDSHEDLNPEWPHESKTRQCFGLHREVSVPVNVPDTETHEMTSDRFNLKRSQSDNSSDVSYYKKWDIVGDTFDARFPWQRDVSVQCNINQDNGYSRHASSCGRDDAFYSPMSPVCLRTDRPSGRTRSQRPNSLGQMDNYKYNCELSRFRENYSERTRKSDPSIMFQFQSPPQSRKRMPMVLSDDTGSISDLESIMENPDNSCSDFSRNTSVTSYDDDETDGNYEISKLCALPESSDDDRQVILPSPPMTSQLLERLADFRHASDAESDSSSEVLQDVPSSTGKMSPSHRKRKQRKQPQRRLSSGSITDGSEVEVEPASPPVARRGRRSAIFETKNCGDVSPTTLSPDVSPSNSCDEGEGASNIAERLRRRRSSVDLAMNIYPGDLLVQEHHKKLIKRNTIADFYAPALGGMPPCNGAGPHSSPGDDSKDSRKGRQPFSLLKLMKTRSKESLTQLGECLSKIKRSEFKDNHLAAYKNLHWSDLIVSSDKQDKLPISETERKRRETVWELFKCECVFLIDHLMVIKHCFMEPLKKLQVEDFLMFAEPQDLFCNLDELCYVSYTFCKDFLAALLKDMSCTEFLRTEILIKAFQRFSTHSKNGAVYHTYCLNYSNALVYLEKLRQNPEFAEYEKWCQQDPRCNRLQITDLLVAPMQHCTKLPLLLSNIRKYTVGEVEKQQLTDSIQKVENSLKQLEEKMKWVYNYARVQEIQQQVVWPAVTDLDPRSYIPECLKSSLSKQPCERLLTCAKRQLIFEGALILIESTKQVDVHLFIFDDILLLTKVKRSPRKKQLTSESGQPDRSSYIVYRQPVALDRFAVHDISTNDATACGLKNIFVIVQFSRFQQIIGVSTLQAQCETSKTTWITQIKEAKEKYCEKASSRQNSFKENKDPRADEKVSPRRSRRSGQMRRIPGKSRSMDAMFL